VSLAGSIGAQSSDSFEDYPAITNRTNADFLQVLLREAREDPIAYLVLAECRLVSFEAKAPHFQRRWISDFTQRREKLGLLTQFTRIVAGEHGEPGDEMTVSTPTKKKSPADRRGAKVRYHRKKVRYHRKIDGRQSGRLPRKYLSFQGALLRMLISQCRDPP
jgi:hypothetical protein